MPGYRSRNALEKRIDLANGYFVVVQKLSGVDAKALQAIVLGNAKARQRSISTGEDGEDTRTETEMDLDLSSAAYTDELLVRGIKEWNLDDEHGQVLPVRAGLDSLYEDDYNLLVKEIKGLSRSVTAAQKKS